MPLTAASPGRAKKRNYVRGEDWLFVCTCVVGKPVCDGHFWLALRQFLHQAPAAVRFAPALETVRV